ncbi:hypothetical protein EVAR_23182_1 [Eumeta japonica]|uniref:Uncharacterized protein n=1 Tax=Eumeta variegata TaxID=151549 RepID=A0A4C1SG31_EUMVA|nr:hypothetical protein EVAR_23182_1 [Eumeta japonica]
MSRRPLINLHSRDDTPRHGPLPNAPPRRRHDRDPTTVSPKIRIRLATLDRSFVAFKKRASSPLSTHFESSRGSHNTQLALNPTMFHRKPHHRNGRRVTATSAKWSFAHGHYRGIDKRSRCETIVAGIHQSQPPSAYLAATSVGAQMRNVDSMTARLRRSVTRRETDEIYPAQGGARAARAKSPTTPTPRPSSARRPTPAVGRSCRVLRSTTYFLYAAIFLEHPIWAVRNALRRNSFPEIKIYFVYIWVQK